MNAQQRKTLRQQLNELSDIRTLVEGLRDGENGEKPIDEVAVAAGRLDDVRSVVENERDEEQGKYDNTPESLQGGEKGERMQSGIDALETAIDALQTAVQTLENVEWDAEEFDLSDALDVLDGIDEAEGAIGEAVAA